MPQHGTLMCRIVCSRYKNLHWNVILLLNDKMAQECDGCFFVTWPSSIRVQLNSQPCIFVVAMQRCYRLEANLLKVNGTSGTSYPMEGSFRFWSKYENADHQQSQVRWKVSLCMRFKGQIPFIKVKQS